MANDVLQVIVEGLEGEEMKNVQAALALPPGLIRDGVVDRPLLDYFLRQVPEKVRQAMEPFGYYSPGAAATLEKTAEGGERLRVKVVPGEPVRISEVRITIQGPGAEEKPLQDLVAASPLKKGDVLNQVQYEKEKGELKAKALDLGYLNADFSVHQIRISREELKAEIELVLGTGPQFHFGEVNFSGAATYPEPFLRRYLAFKPGEIFSYAKLGETQLNLINSDRFKTVTLQARKEEARDLRIPVEVKLTPSPAKRLRPGIGYGTDTGARVSLRYQDVNVFHQGHEWNSELSLSERLRGLATRYILPSHADLNSYTSFQLGLRQELLTTYDSQLITLEAERARGFGKGRLGSLYLQLRQERFSVGAEQGDSHLVMPGLRFSGRRFDNLIRPTRGYRYSLETRGTDQILGSDTGFLQQLAEGNLLIPLPYRFSVFTRLQAGATAQNGPLAELPASLRFFAGGDRSVRGYSYQSLGPKDSSGKVVGGRHLLVSSLELEKALGKSWGVAAFYDVGNAFDTFGDMRLAQSAGMGIRYYTRVGPIRVDVARPINVENPHFRLHFTVGFEL